MESSIDNQEIRGLDDLLTFHMRWSYRTNPLSSGSPTSPTYSVTTRDDLRDDVTTEEIEKFEVDEENRRAAAKARDQKEDDLLALCGLTRGDFCRLRGVSRSGDVLHVETRENGMHMRSVEAVRNEHYIRSYGDDCDTTYEYYEFRIPEEK